MPVTLAESAPPDAYPKLSYKTVACAGPADESDMAAIAMPILLRIFMLPDIPRRDSTLPEESI
jgi:hypothetical protein